MRFGLIVLGSAIAACAEARAPAPGSFTLANGVELPLLSGVKLVSDCAPDNVRPTEMPDIVCLEIPRALAIPGPGELVQNDYANVLVQKGFTFEGGASIAYWFRWPEQNGCSRRLTIATVPKPTMSSQQVQASGDTYVLVMDLDSSECPNQ